MSEEMGDVACVGHEPCPDCGSKDNLARYTDGHAYCFTPGCARYEVGDIKDGEGNGTSDRTGTDVDQSDSRTDATQSSIETTYEALVTRKISEATCRRFKYGIGQYKGQNVQVAQYGRVQKIRRADKTFAWLSAPPGSLFGQQLWRPQRRLVITEGEIDCLSYAEATDCKWPVVSVPNGAGGAARSIAQNIEWVTAFEEVIFLFDMDDPGQLAAVECAKLLPPGKALIGTLTEKDANDVLRTPGGIKELYAAPFKARPYRPDGIVEGVELLEKVLSPPIPGLSYPWPCLDRLTYGQRRGELVTWIAGTGTGKTQVLREVTRHLWIEHKERVGIIALEESNTHSALGQLSLELNKKLHLPAVRAEVSDEEMIAAGERILPGFAFYDHFGSVQAEVLMPKIRYMAHAMGIRWIVLDHLSIMISGMAEDGDERKRIDQIMTQLRSMCSELDLGIHIVSHLRKASGKPHEEGGQISLQDIRGSGSPAQISNIVIALERDQQADDGSMNTTILRVLKNRFTGETGIAGEIGFNTETGRLTEEDAYGGTSHEDY